MSFFYLRISQKNSTLMTLLCSYLGRDTLQWLSFGFDLNSCLRKNQSDSIKISICCTVSSEEFSTSNVELPDLYAGYEMSKKTQFSLIHCKNWLFTGLLRGTNMIISFSQMRSITSRSLKHSMLGVMCFSMLGTSSLNS